MGGNQTLCLMQRYFHLCHSDLPLCPGYDLFQGIVTLWSYDLPEVFCAQKEIILFHHWPNWVMIKKSRWYWSIYWYLPATTHWILAIITFLRFIKGKKTAWLYFINLGLCCWWDGKTWVVISTVKLLHDEISNLTLILFVTIILVNNYF